MTYQAAEVKTKKAKVMQSKAFEKMKHIYIKPFRYAVTNDLDLFPPENEDQFKKMEMSWFPDLTTVSRLEYVGAKKSIKSEA